MRDSTIIRAANAADIPALTSICAEAFPGERRWLSPVTATRWWGVVVASDHAEVWVMEDAGSALGLLLIVHDEVGWNAEKTRRRPTMTDVLQAGPRVWFARRSTPASNVRSREPSELPVAERVWIELIAIRPIAQGRGLGTRLLDHADERTIALGRRAIRLNVYEANAGAHAAYERTGYLHDGDHDGRRVYTKHLNT